MARSGINKVILIGNLGKDPETNHMPSGDSVTNITLATSESWKDKQTGEKQEKTEWHRVVFFKRLAEVAAEYLRKGSKVYVEGRLQTRKWQDQNGNDRYTAEIIANDMQMLDSKSAQQQSPANHGLASYAPKQSDETLQEQMSSPANTSQEFEDDDIPF